MKNINEHIWILIQRNITQTEICMINNLLNKCMALNRKKEEKHFCSYKWWNLSSHGALKPKNQFAKIIALIA